MEKLAKITPLMKKHYTVPIPLSSLPDQIELAAILGSYSVGLDNPNEREVKRGADICRRIPGIELVLWFGVDFDVKTKLVQATKWLTDFQELYHLHIQPRVIYAYDKPARVSRHQCETGWLLEGDVRNKHMGCVLDSVPNWGLMQQTYNKTCEVADSIGIKQVIPWISLGVGRKADGVNEITEVTDWNYDEALDEWAGWEINSKLCSDQYPRYPRWSRAGHVIVERCKMDDHLVSYLKGATRR